MGLLRLAQHGVGALHGAEAQGALHVALEADHEAEGGNVVHALAVAHLRVPPRAGAENVGQQRLPGPWGGKEGAGRQWGARGVRRASRTVGVAKQGVLRERAAQIAENFACDGTGGAGRSVRRGAATADGVSSPSTPCVSRKAAPPRPGPMTRL